MGVVVVVVVLAVYGSLSKIDARCPVANDTDGH